MLYLLNVIMWPVPSLEKLCFVFLPVLFRFQNVIFTLKYFQSGFCDLVYNALGISSRTAKDFCDLNNAHTVIIVYVVSFRCFINQCIFPCRGINVDKDCLRCRKKCCRCSCCLCRCHKVGHKAMSPLDLSGLNGAWDIPSCKGNIVWCQALENVPNHVSTGEKNVLIRIFSQLHEIVWWFCYEHKSLSGWFALQITIFSSVNCRWWLNDLLQKSEFEVTLFWQ